VGKWWVLICLGRKVRGCVGRSMARYVCVGGLEVWWVGRWVDW
jgi:hypothetical protein